ncbi:MAG: energy-coupling factor transporter transmembrane component T [Acutalibacteraceae bacterium]|nr:energy-coupling factor transporter transmembrane protein EcfT [Clostridiales bacterium]
MNDFVKLHPSVLALYFLSTIIITMFTSNPIIICISFFASICLYFTLFGFLQLAEKLKSFIIIIFLCTIFNPLFSQNGQTIVLEFSIIKITLQSLLFGLNFGIMLVCSMLWFLCLSKVMSSEKIVYLLGKKAPKTALTISLALKLVPDFFKKFHNTAMSQKALGLYHQGSFKERIKSSRDVFLSVCADVLESSAQTSDSIRARGFGINKFAVYSRYKFYKRDYFILISIVLLLAGIVLCRIYGDIKFYFYPNFSKISTDIYSVFFYLFFTVFALLPIIINFKEGIKWRYLVSKI